MSDVSILPSEAQKGGGGVVQAVQGATLTLECVTYDYNGSVAVPVPALHVHGEYEVDGEAAEFDEYYSAGDPSRLRPKADGSAFQAITEGAGLTDTCKAMQFVASIVSANGGDEDILSGGFPGLNGINVNMERKPDIERAGLEPKKGGRGRTILVVTEINSLPGEGKKGKKVVGKAPVGKPAGKPAGGPKAAIRKEAIELVEAAIAAAGGSVESENIGQLVFRANKKNPNIKAIMALAADAEFLAAEDTPWGFDGTNLTSGE